MKTITINGDFFLNTGYWQYECEVQINPKTRLVWDVELIKIKGSGPDDESLESNEDIEDIAREKAEMKAEEMIGDPLVPLELNDEESEDV